ncbi:hypothetical protein [Thalassoroseus pseudoceratinae]|uniref:hypothetical protein n=1 Tax=Thalassoroseus pseudoceratinae TaxID=2713176 RepID=UPI0014230F1E|nr:hypothetical protein [Thalassoroseus pseudoceratinae]
MRLSSVRVFALALTTSVMCAGCGEDWQADTYPAEGTITINGEPPVGALVQLHPTGEATDKRESLPWGLVQDDGTYTLSTYEMGDGAPIGEYAITIRWSPNVNTPSLVDRLNNAYNNPEQSEWKVTIDADENELPPIEITGAKVMSADQVVGRRRPPGPGMGN